jgi:hypothetical protein
MTSILHPPGMIRGMTIYRDVSFIDKRLFILNTKEALAVWVLTHYSEAGIKMYEFDNKEEAKEKYKNTPGNKILSEVIYFTDFPVPEFV